MHSPKPEQPNHEDPKHRLASDLSSDGGCPFRALAPQTKTLSYGDYLHLDELLTTQKLQSAGKVKLQPASSEASSHFAHDEMLFIIVHQAHELWFKQILFELDSVLHICRRNHIEESTIGTATARLERIVTILNLLSEHLRILETMTPMDFLEFRNFLNPASGFQSVQFRLLEAKLGLPKKHLEHLNSGLFAEIVSDRERALLRQTIAEKSLFEVVEDWLERTPFLETPEFSFWSAYKLAIERHIQSDAEIVHQLTSLDETEKKNRLAEIERTQQAYMDLFDFEKHEKFLKTGAKRLSLRATHAALFIYLYRDQPILQAPYRFLTQMTMIDELLQKWRAGHSQMVHRMIGIKIGTGGSSGYEYLRSTVYTHSIFSDLCGLSTFLLPRSALPELPQGFIRKLGFWNESGSA